MPATLLAIEPIRFSIRLTFEVCVILHVVE